MRASAASAATHHAGTSLALPAYRETHGKARTTLTLSSRNYSSWSLRGWLLARFAGLDFDEVMVSPDDADTRAEMLLLAPSILVPCLRHQGVKVWDTLAIAEYLHEIRPKAGRLPADRAARALPRDLRRGAPGLHVAALGAADEPERLVPGDKVWSRAQADIDRVLQIWRECLQVYGGPFLFGAQRGMADAMYAPVVTRLRTYDAEPGDPACRAFCAAILALPEMQQWIAAAPREPEAIDELEVEF